MTKRGKRIRFLRLLDMASSRPERTDAEYERQWHAEKAGNFEARDRARLENVYRTNGTPKPSFAGFELRRKRVIDATHTTEAALLRCATALAQG